MRNYLMEFIGAMFLVMAVLFTGNPIAIGIMLMVMIYIGGHVSGGHYNPAVTLAVCLRGKLPAKDVPGYWIAQVLGAFVAAVIHYVVTDKGGAPVPAEGIAVWKPLLMEILCTFALASTVLAVATSEKLKGNFIYGLAIGFTVLTCAFVAGPISGGAFNTAVALGPQIMDAIIGNDSIKFFWIYLVGTLGGGVLAALVYKVLNDD